MSKTATVRARIEPDLKHEVEDVFHNLGISTTDAINIFFTQVKLHHGLPFSVTIPNATTEATFKATDKDEDITAFNSANDLFSELEI